MKAAARHIATGVLITTLVLVGLLHIPAILTPVLQQTVSAVLPDSVDLSFSRVSGSPFRVLTLSDVRMATTGDSTWLEVDSVTVGYRLWSVFSTPDIGPVRLGQTRFHATQRSDGSFILPDFSNPDTASTFLRLHDITVADMSGILGRARTDSTVWSLDRGFLGIPAVDMGYSVSATLDTLGLSFTYPSVGSGSLNASGAVASDGTVSLHLNGRAPASDFDISVSGAPDPDARSGLDHLSASGSGVLGLDDLTPFLSDLQPGATIAMDLSAAGGPDTLTVALDLDAGPAGRIVLRGGLPEFGLPFNLTAEIDRLRPNLLLTSVPETTQLNARVETNGAWHDSAFTGTMQMDVQDSRLAGLDVAGGTSVASFSPDSIAWTVQLGAFDAGFESNGWYAPGSGALDATVDFSGLTGKGLGLELDVPVRIGGSVAARGHSDSLVVAYTSIDTHVGDCPVSIPDLKGFWSTARSRLSATVTACGERLATVDVRSTDASAWDGSATFGPAPLDRLLLLADTTSFAGTVSGRAAVAENGSLSRFSMAARLNGIRAGNTRLDSLQSTISGSSVRVDVTAAAWLDSGEARTAGTVDLGKSRTEIILSELILRSFALSDMLQVPDQQLIVSGRGSASVALDSDGLLHGANVDMDLSGSVVNDVQFESAMVQAEARGDSLLASVRVGADSLSVSANVGWFASRDSLVTISGRFDRAQLGALLALDELSTQLAGTFDGTFHVRDGQPIGEALVSLDGGSRINRFIAGGGSVRVRLDPTATSGKLAISGRPTSSGTIPGASASFGLQGDHLYADARFSRLPIAEILDEPVESRLWGAFIANVYLNEERDGYTEFMLTADSLRGAWGALELDNGHTDLRVTPAMVHVDSLLLIGPDLDVQGAGRIAIASTTERSEFRMAATVPPAIMTLPGLSGVDASFLSLSSDVRVAGPYAGRRVVVDLTARGVRSGDLMFNELKGRVLAQMEDGLEPSGGELTLTSGVFDTGGLSARGATLRVGYDGEEISTDLELDITDERNLRVGAVTALGDEPMVLVVDMMTAQLDEDEWQLDAPVRITLSDVPTISGLILSSGAQRIAATSAVRGSSIQHLVTMDSVRIGTLAEMFAFPGLDGTVTGVLTARPEPSGAYAVQGTINAALLAFGQDVGALVTRINMSNEQLSLDAELVHPDGGIATAVGRLPLGDDGAQTVQFRVSTETYPIGWTRVFVDPALVDDLRGVLSGSVDIGGSADAPSWSGAMQFRNGRVGLPDLGKRRGLRYDDVEADLSFRADSIIVDRATAHSGNGSVHGSGGIAMTDLQLGSIDLSFTARDFLAINNSAYRAVVAGSGRLQGTTDRPVLSGNIEVVSADFHLTDETTADAFEPVTLSDHDLLTLQQRFGVRIAAEDTTSFDFYRVLAMDNLTIRMQRDTWVRSRSNPEMDIQIQGSLDMGKRRNEDPTVFGTIAVIPARSQLKQFGRRFAIDRGNMTFNGPMDAPVMDLEASYEVPSRAGGGQEVTIRLIVSGTPESLDVSFESDPTMELSDIVSYIATGRPASESFQLAGVQTNSYLQSAAGLAMGPVTDLIENLAGAGLGLDVIEISQTGVQGLTLTAGKYVSPTLYVSISQPISLSASSERSTTSGENATQVALEYELVRQLLLSLLNRGTILQVNLRWEYAF